MQNIEVEGQMDQKSKDQGKQKEKHGPNDTTDSITFPANMIDNYTLK